MAFSSFIIIGCGHMGAAITRGLTAHPNDYHITCVDQDLQKAQALADSLLHPHEVSVLSSLSERSVEPCMIILAVKPHQIVSVIGELNGKFLPNDIIVSVAAGVPYCALSAALEKTKCPKTQVVRAMPNLPAAVQKGVTALYSPSNIPSAVRSAFSSIGEVVLLEKEEEFHAFTALAGSLPAFVFVALEALADGAVALGMTRERARFVAVQTLLGAAEYAKSSPHHTAELKDHVASPGGTTIAGLQSLEQNRFRFTLIQAIKETAERSKSMEKSSS